MSINGGGCVHPSIGWCGSSKTELTVTTPPRVSVLEHVTSIGGRYASDPSQDTDSPVGRRMVTRRGTTPHLWSRVGTRGSTVPST